jgi:hypothetical protein
MNELSKVSCVRDSKPARGLCSGHDLSVKQYKNVVPAIALLLFVCRPPAILWRVVSVYVNSVNGMIFGWLFAHVGKKVFKLCPPVANRYSTPAVMSPRIAFGVLASVFDFVPSFVLWRFCQSMRSIHCVQSRNLLASA